MRLSPAQREVLEAMRDGWTLRREWFGHLWHWWLELDNERHCKVTCGTAGRLVRLAYIDLLKDITVWQLTPAGRAAVEEKQ